MAEKPDVIKVENGRFIMDVALQTPRPSGSGKSIVHFTTGGNVKVDDKHIVGVNLYSKK